MSSSFNAAKFAVFPLSNGKVKLEFPAAENAELASLGDEDLIGKIHSGDQGALGVLFHRYANLVRSVGKRILRDEGEAEDLVQDVFLYLFRSSSAFDSRKGPARSWIVQNIYYRAINRRRYLSSRHSLFGTAPKPLLDLDARATDHRSAETAIFEGALVQEILKSLTPEQFETIRLFFFEGYTLAEIGENLGQSLGNVRHQYYRGLNRLRTRLFLE
jgi:RNA polymerase sigma-70 factor (ECF subfamily)